MTAHPTATREEWLAARLELLEAEKALTRRSDEVARQRQALPWVPVEKAYRFDTEDGPASLADLFRGRSQLLVYHFMFGPEYSAGCVACSAIADGFNGIAVHLENHDVAFTAVSQAPLEAILAYRERMGWTFAWASAQGSDFNLDFDVSTTEAQQRDHAVAEYNYRSYEISVPSGEAIERMAELAGVDPATYTRQSPGMSAFALAGGAVHHTYSTYARGLDGLWGMYQWLDRAPLGRNESGPWFSRHDEYGDRAQ